MDAEVELVEEPAAALAPAPARPRRGPKAPLQRAVSRFMGMTTVRKALVLIVAVVIIAAIIAVTLSKGGGFGGGGGPNIVSNWNLGGLSEQLREGSDEDGANIEGQTTPYVERFEPGQHEVYFITKVTANVTWDDETTQPTKVQVPGYVNQPDSFQLFIVVQGFAETISSELTYNAQGQQGAIALEFTFPKPIPVANPDDAEYLPSGYNATTRIDFKVYTGECGDWSPPLDRLPTIGDGGSYYVFTWSVTYLVDGDGKP
jgi:hypothetical protein